LQERPRRTRRIHPWNTRQALTEQTPNIVTVSGIARRVDVVRRLLLKGAYDEIVPVPRTDSEKR